MAFRSLPRLGTSGVGRTEGVRAATQVAQSALMLTPHMWTALTDLAVAVELPPVLILGVALQVLLYRYTRGEADLTLTLGMGAGAKDGASAGRAFDAGLAQPVAGGQMTIGSATVSLPSCVSGEQTFAQALRLTAATVANAPWVSDLKAVADLKQKLHYYWRGTGPEQIVQLELQLASPAGAATFSPSLGLSAKFTVEGPASVAWEGVALATHWEVLLNSAVSRPGDRLWSLDLLGESELKRLTEEFSGVALAAPAPAVSSLAEIFTQKAVARPHHPAVVGPDRTYTYGELELRANHLANYLRYVGVCLGDIVALYMPRGADAFVGLLAILKAGAAYVPVDPGYPAERVDFIIHDSAAKAVVTVSELASRLGATASKSARVIALDTEWDRIRFEAEYLDFAGPPRLGDLAYIIYTSGSTGQPKGVMIEHRAVVNFVRAEEQVLGVKATDRVYQGFSLAFDASVEEIWLAFAAGATLVVADADTARSGPSLANFLKTERVSVLSCVPTLLMMIEDELPLVRLLILGGEECQAELVRRWQSPGRRLINSYGPTEATVVATLGEVRKGDVVTIGRPLPGVCVFVVDEWLQPVPIGVAGELCIAGSGLARGYLGQAEATERQFTLSPLALGNVRLYRSGDLVRFLASGELVFLGRSDAQVKLRGYRVELGEIETALLREGGVRAAAASVQVDMQGIKQLVGFVVPKGVTEPNSLELRTALRASLPHYMVPVHIEVVASLPTLPSGKVERKRLPEVLIRASTPTPAACKGRAPATEMEHLVHDLWSKMFAPEWVGMEDDFFALGGHSLLATRMLGELRRDPRFSTLSVLDIYHHPTAAALALQLASRVAEPPSRTPSMAPARVGGSGRFSLGSAARVMANAAAQCGGLYCLFAFISIGWLVPLFSYHYYAGHSSAMWPAVLIGLGLATLLAPAQLLLGVLVKWLVIGRFRAGSYPLWGAYYWRFWLVRRVLELCAPKYLCGSPWLASYTRLLGAKIGKDVFLGTDGFVAYDLLTVEDGATLEADVMATGYAVDRGQLHIGRVTVGKNAHVGARCVLSQGSQVEGGGALGELSLLPTGQTVGAGEYWQGSPARLVGPAPTPELKRERASSEAGALGYQAAFLLAACILRLVPPIAAALPVALGSWLYSLGGFAAVLLCSPLLIAVYVLAYCLTVAAVKWLAVGRVAPGAYPVRSYFYVRKWLVDALLADSLATVGPLYATIYLQPWLRLLGMRVGTQVEMSTAAHFTPDLVELNDECFVADAVCFAPPRVHLGVMTLGKAVVGRQAFVGNSAFLRSGTVLGDGGLLGCLSRPPLDLSRVARRDSSWLGSPGTFLPRREHHGQAQADIAALTFKPTLGLYLVRGAIEFFRITLPDACSLMLTLALVYVAAPIYTSSLWLAVLLLPVALLGVGIGAALTVILTKWLLMGRYRACTRPLWSHFVWRTELVDAMHQQLATPLLLRMLLGTPLLAVYFRGLGTKLGKRVYLETTNITEFDLVTLGDEVCLDAECDLQTHLFEDRIMKMSTVSVAKGASVGPMSLVLYDTLVQENARLGGLSLVMKGEIVPAASHWHGAPLVRVTHD